MVQHEKEASVNLDKLAESNDQTGSILNAVSDLIKEFDLRIESLEDIPEEAT